MASTRDLLDALERAIADGSGLYEDSKSDLYGEGVQGHLPTASPDLFDPGEDTGDGSR